MSEMVNIVEPANYEEASKSDAWRAPMYEEIESINRNHTWDLVELLEGKIPIRCKWLYKPKINADGSIEKLKARLVAKGYSQQEGIYFDDTFAPVAKLNTIRMLISLATKHKWKLHQLDVKSAFLNDDWKEEIYLVQPEGFVKKGQEHLVCKLKKALYCLKQAPRSWYEKIDSFFVQHGFHRSFNDPNLYTKFNKQRQIILISLYVDDMIITRNANNLIKEITQQMSQVFEMKDLGNLHYCLGLERQIILISLYVDDMIITRNANNLIKEITQQMSQVFEMKDLGNLHYCLGLEVWKDSGQTFLTQEKYARNLLERFRMEQWRSATTPVYQNLKLSSVDGFLDSDWAGNLDDRRSIIGYAFNIGSGVIAWSSKKQSTIALSSCEAEYQELCAPTCEAIWLRRLLNDAGEEQRESTIIKTNNQSTIKIAYNRVFHKNTKHIDTQFHFVCEKLQSKEICVQ
eukprot:PITA_06942